MIFVKTISGKVTCNLCGGSEPFNISLEEMTPVTVGKRLIKRIQESLPHRRIPHELIYFWIIKDHSAKCPYCQFKEEGEVDND